MVSVTPISTTVTPVTVAITPISVNVSSITVIVTPITATSLYGKRVHAFDFLTTFHTALRGACGVRECILLINTVSLPTALCLAAQTSYLYHNYRNQLQEPPSLPLSETKKQRKVVTVQP